MVVLLIALIVIKPEQLPEVAAALGRFLQSVRRMFTKVKDEMNGFIDTLPEPKEEKREQP